MRKESSLLSKLFFSWIFKILRINFDQKPVTIILFEFVIYTYRTKSRTILCQILVQIMKEWSLFWKITCRNFDYPVSSLSSIGAQTAFEFHMSGFFIEIVFFAFFRSSLHFDKFFSSFSSNYNNVFQLFQNVSSFFFGFDKCIRI